MLVSKIKNNNANYNLKTLSKKRYYSYNLPNESDIFMNTKQNKQISFSGCLGIENYGSQEDKDALKYRIQLTPEKIDDIMRTAKSTDDGLIAVHRALSTEAQHVTRAFLGFKAIKKQAFLFAKSRLEGLNEDYVKPGKTKVIGVVTHLGSRITGGAGRLNQDILYLLTDFENIVEVRFNNGLYDIANDYIKLSQYFQDGVSYVITRKGSTPLREKLLDFHKRRQEKYETSYNSIKNQIGQQSEAISKRAGITMRSYKSLTAIKSMKAIKWGTRIARIISGAG